MSAAAVGKVFIIKFGRETFVLANSETDALARRRFSQNPRAKTDGPRVERIERPPTRVGRVACSTM